MRQLDISSEQKQEQLRRIAPLAERLRPQSLDEFVGQPHLLGSGRFLDRLVSGAQFQSLILWGPPGCGKTTLARLIARNTHSHLISLSAVAAGTREIRAAVEQAREKWTRKELRSWLFMDEIHRLNKAQQDTLLPHVEQGTILLLGATTENPSFEIIRPLLSRVRVLVLEALDQDALSRLLEKALTDRSRGLGSFPAVLDSEARDALIALSGGDARILLNTLELAVLTTPADETGTRHIDAEAVFEAAQRRPVHYDKNGEEHFNLLSAFHKSLRGSDPDAALYWFFRMVNAGEDPLVPARRLVAAASEDVGLADPYAIMQAMSAVEAYQLLGSPEGELALAQAIIYVALAPKSNAVYLALRAAREAARTTGTAPVPIHLRNAPTGLLKSLGYGKKYRYPHDDPRGWVAETYLPETLRGTTFFEPKGHGWEARWRETIRKRREQVDRAHREG